MYKQTYKHTDKRTNRQTDKETEEKTGVVWAGRPAVHGAALRRAGSRHRRLLPAPALLGQWRGKPARGWILSSDARFPDSPSYQHQLTHCSEVGWGKNGEMAAVGFLLAAVSASVVCSHLCPV